jgi:hypothetical protein
MLSQKFLCTKMFPFVVPAQAGIQIFIEFPGFRVALAIASLPGMTSGV